MAFRLLSKIFFFFMLVFEFKALYPTWQESLTGDAQQLLAQINKISNKVSCFDGQTQWPDEELLAIFSHIKQAAPDVHYQIQGLEIKNEKWAIPSSSFYACSFEHYGNSYKVADCMGSQELFGNIVQSAGDILKDKDHPLHGHLLELFQAYISHDEEFVQVFRDELGYQFNDAAITEFFNAVEIQKKYEKTFNRFIFPLSKRVQDSEGNWRREAIGYKLNPLKLSGIFSAIPGTFAASKLLIRAAELYECSQKHQIRDCDNLSWFFPVSRNGNALTLSNESRITLVSRMLHLLKAKDTWLKAQADNNFSCTINFLPIPLCKKFPKKSSLFKNVHINSAVYSSSLNLLSIFRSEEMLKLLTHEFLHRIDFDAPAISFSEENLALLQSFSEKYAVEKKNSRGSGPCDLYLDEAVTEAAAVLLNVIFLAAEHEDSLQVFKEMWMFEKIFAAFQIAKILYISGFCSFEEFCNPAETDKRVQQWTSVVEYHIFKAALLQDLQQFIGAFTRCGNVQENLTFDDVVTNINEGMNNSELADIVNSFLELLRSEAINKDSFLYRTGRMTLIEQRLD